MKKIIPFSKTIPFKSKIFEITDIEVKHTLVKGQNNEIVGSFLLNGKYKITEESLNEEEFNYELPFSLDISDNYNLDNSEILINDFYFEIINEEDLKINIELEINNIEEKEEVIKTRCYDNFDESEKYNVDDFDEINPDGLIMDEFKDDTEKLEINNNITDLFNNLTNETEYKSYYVYILREFDTIDTVINKYKVTKEELEMYNDLKDIKVGTKLIIPCSNE